MESRILPPQTSFGSKSIISNPKQPSYHLRLAESENDLRDVQRLRFRVFNLECGAGYNSSLQSGRDEDHFDKSCDHLIVETNDKVVGTYRLQTGTVARREFGYYSAREFDLSAFASMDHEVIEIGRGCILGGYRNGIILRLLWRGIISYANAHGCRHFIGCSSILSQNLSEGINLYNTLAKHHLAPPEWRTYPMVGYECVSTTLDSKEAKLPKLLEAYLNLGAKICAPPALDRGFGTIDLLTYFDLRTLTRRI